MSGRDRVAVFAGLVAVAAGAALATSQLVGQGLAAWRGALGGWWAGWRIL